MPSRPRSRRGRLETICRLIALYHLDRGWAEHLAYLAEVREGIHLRALGRQDPLDEFHRMAVTRSTRWSPSDRGGTADLRDRDLIEDEPADLAQLVRPTSTWTYMVHDNPLADNAMSALSLPGVFR